MHDTCVGKKTLELSVTVLDPKNFAGCVGGSAESLWQTRLSCWKLKVGSWGMYSIYPLLVYLIGAPFSNFMGKIEI